MGVFPWALAIYHCIEKPDSKIYCFSTEIHTHIARLINLRSEIYTQQMFTDKIMFLSPKFTKEMRHEVVALNKCHDACRKIVDFLLGINFAECPF